MVHERDMCTDHYINNTEHSWRWWQDRGKRSLWGLGRRAGFGYTKDLQSGRACICRALSWGDLRAHGWGVGKGDTIFGTGNDSYGGWVIGSQQIILGGEDSTRVVLYEVDLAEDWKISWKEMTWRQKHWYLQTGSASMSQPVSMAQSGAVGFAGQEPCEGYSIGSQGQLLREGGRRVREREKVKGKLKLSLKARALELWWDHR